MFCDQRRTLSSTGSGSVCVCGGVFFVFSEDGLGRRVFYSNRKTDKNLL